MSTGGALAGGFAGTLVLALALESATHARLTRLDLLLLLGTAARLDTAAARAVGFAAQLAIGMASALAYPPVLDALGWGSWSGAAVLGAGHGALVAAAIGLLLPRVHPRLRAGEDATRIEAPGAWLGGYGALSAPVLVAAHVLYGAVVGAFAAGG